jgi:hypothetical protein
MAGNSPSPAGTVPQPSVKDQTSALTPSPVPSFTYREGHGISYELSDAPPMCVRTSLHSMTLDEMQVLAWLQQYRGEIVSAAKEFQVDRRAIAGAIAWEALENVHGSFGGGFRKTAGVIVGPGKLHLQRPTWGAVMGSGLVYPKFTDDDTWPKATEDAGLMSKPKTADDRAAVAATPKGSIRYIAASFDLIATTYEKAGSPGKCDPPIRHNPVILTNVYQAKDPSQWAHRVKTIKPGETLKGGNEMDIWIGRHIQYLEDGVGTP